jgi:hypothetical protein
MFSHSVQNSTVDTGESILKITENDKTKYNKGDDTTNRKKKILENTARNNEHQRKKRANIVNTN